MKKKKTLNIILVIISIITAVGLLAGIGSAFGSSGTTSSSSNKKPSGGNTGNTTPPEDEIPEDTFIGVVDMSTEVGDFDSFEYAENITISNGDWIRLSYSDGVAYHCVEDGAIRFGSIEEHSIEFFDSSFEVHLDSIDCLPIYFELYKVNHSGYSVEFEGCDYGSDMEFAINSSLNYSNISEDYGYWYDSLGDSTIANVFLFECSLNWEFDQIFLNVYSSSTDELIESIELKNGEIITVGITCDCRFEFLVVPGTASINEAASSASYSLRNNETDEDPYLYNMEVPGTEMPIIGAECDGFEDVE